MLEPGHYFVLITALRAAGFAVAALHLRGHGLARQIQGDPGTFAELLGEGRLAEQWLLANGFGPVATAGHSQGGILATAHAAASASLTASFAIGSILPQMPEAIAITRFAPLAARRQAIIAMLAWLNRRLPGLPLPLPFYLQIGRILAGRRQARVGDGKARLAYPLNYLLSLFTAYVPEDLRCPFWLLSARDDALFTPYLTELVYARLRAPAKELVWLAYGGHMAIFNERMASYAARAMASACAGLNFPLNIQMEQ